MGTELGPSSNMGPGPPCVGYQHATGGRGTRILKHRSGTTSLVCKTRPQTHKSVLASSLLILPRPKALPFPPQFCSLLWIYAEIQHCK